MQKFSFGTVSHWSLTSRQPHMRTSRPSLAEAATSLIFVGTKVCVCRDKTRLLSRQKYACRDKIVCLSRQMFCDDKHTFVATKIILVAAPAKDARRQT